MSFCQAFISRFALFLCAALFVQSSIAQVATLEGTVIKMPVVVVGTTQFSVDLSLDLGSDPITFSLAAAAETSGGDTTNAPFLEGVVLKIPTLVVNGTDFFVDLTLISDAPVKFQLSNIGANSVAPTSDELRALALDLFTQNIDQPIINSRCVVCHVQGGNAGGTPLVYARASATSTAANFAVIETYLQSRPNGVQTILSKASGAVAHTGGTQLSSGSTDFANLSAFLTALAAAVAAQ
jgi:hypothetical protein